MEIETDGDRAAVLSSSLAESQLSVPKPLPTVLAPEDQMRFELLIEKLGRIDAQAVNARLQLERLQADFAQTSRQREMLWKELAAKYFLSDQDKIVPETGAINRAVLKP